MNIYDNDTVVDDDAGDELRGRFACISQVSVYLDTYSIFNLFAAGDVVDWVRIKAHLPPIITYRSYYYLLFY